MISLDVLPASIDTRPPEYAGNAHSAFVDRADPAPERREAGVGPLVERWSVVACKDDDGIIVLYLISLSVSSTWPT